MKYIKHYYVDANSGNFLTSQSSIDSVKEMRHPVLEYPELNVKMQVQDSDGIDVCISEVPDNTSVNNIVSDENGKYSVKVLTEEEYNFIISLKEEIDVLSLISSNNLTIKNTIKEKVKSFNNFVNS